MGVTWLTVFLDSPVELAFATERFWAAVTGWPVSARRGEHDEFATLQPTDGDGLVRLQTVGDPPPGLAHLDVHAADAADVAALNDRAGQLGAERVADGAGFVTHRSPGGITFCVVPHGGGRRPAPVSWPAGHSLVDQVCVDVPGGAFETEVHFWSDLLGWPRQATGRPELERLLPPAGQPLQVLLQRLDDTEGPARLHLDLACEDVAAEVGRHLDLGAQGVRVERNWTTLMDPAGRPYCVTGRDPATGRLP